MGSPHRSRLAGREAAAEVDPWPDARGSPEALVKAQRDHQQGLLPTGPTQTVAQFIRPRLEVVKPGLRPATYVSYEGTTRLHILPDLGRVQLDKLTPMHVHGLLERKSATELSPRSARVVMEVLGHSRISVTLDLYRHVFPSELGDAADAMDRALGGQPDEAAGGES